MFSDADPRNRSGSLFQYIPGWIELNFQDFSDVAYRTSVAINMLSTGDSDISRLRVAYLTQVYIHTYITTMII